MTQHSDVASTDSKRSPFVETALSIDNARARISLSGTLMLPDTEVRHPAVVLIHGQGPLDRDMSFAHLRPFRTLAEHLAANGIASVRYDKRGIGESDGDFQSATREDFADDASAALRLLGRHEAILPDRMGLLGQSEGGVIAPMVAADSDDVAFAVLLAGPAISGRDNLVLSFAMFAEASPLHDSSSEDVKELLNRLVDLIHAESPSGDDRVAALQLAETLAPQIVNERTKLVLGGADITAEQFLGFLSSTCLEETFQSAPGTVLRRLTCPILALYAERDRHVQPVENMRAMKEALAATGNRESTVETIAGVNHMFQRCETGYPDEYLTIDHDISPNVLDRVSNWISERVRRGVRGRP